tara:strand:- start:194 stop:841 length:648 start_codon:yes stop_codon:yes gene_type:complete
MRVDIALVLSGVLAFVLMVLLQASVQRVKNTTTVDYVVEARQETVVLIPVGTADPGSNINTVHIVLKTAWAGWPIRTAIASLDPKVSWALPGLTDVVERTTQPGTPLSDHLELAPQIREALADSSDPDIRRFAEGYRLDVDYLVFSIVTGVTWMILWALCLPVIGLIGIGEGVTGRMGSARRRRLRRQNRCENCGYDRKGLDFTAACPECGELLT